MFNRSVSLFAAVAFMAEGLGNGADTVAQEEAVIAQITHLPIEEVDARLTAISQAFGVPKEEVTEVFFRDALAGALPTAEEEAAMEEDGDNDDTDFDNGN